MAFIGKLADRNGATFYYRDRKFYFGPRAERQKRRRRAAWGQGLLGFSPEVNLAAPDHRGPGARPVGGRRAR